MSEVEFPNFGTIQDIYLSEFTKKFDGDTFWQLITGFLVFFMHAGFAMLEAGSIADKHKVNILYKNMANVVFGGVAYFLFGYGFAYGSGTTNNSFLGTDSYFGGGFEQNLFDRESDRIEFFFQLTFCITAATIVSGAVAGRMRLEAFLVLSTILTGLVYPVITHWAWSETGFISAFKGDDVGLYLFNGRYDNACGVIDFAGSGVVHLTGGVAALIAAIMVGPRDQRFMKVNKEGEPDKWIVNPMPGHNLSIATLGTFILWFGWFGFNAGSTLAFDGLNAAKVAVTTALAPATACITSILLQKYRTGKYDLPGALNAILSGLVSITAGCSTVFDFAAIPIGFVGALIYIFSSEKLLKWRVDDPIGAIPVHGFCGIWGVLAVGIFSNPADYANAYDCPNPPVPGEDADWLDPLSGFQMATQIVHVLVIILWTTAIVTPVLYLMKRLRYLRVPVEYETEGLDRSEHGVEPYYQGQGNAVFSAEDVAQDNSMLEELEAKESTLPTSVEHIEEEVLISAERDSVLS